MLLIIGLLHIVLLHRQDVIVNVAINLQPAEIVVFRVSDVSKVIGATARTK